ncbi:MAG: dimethylarginine dimethylaminohydrolase family protein [Geminicoccaceae bacterium]
MNMQPGRSYDFRRAIVREPGASVALGLRAGDTEDPDPALFLQEHRIYVAALRDAGLQVMVLPPLEDFPDSVFVEDAALFAAGRAIALRPGAASRHDEALAIRPALQAASGHVVDLPGDGTIDGGDVLLTDQDAFIGCSARTDDAGANALADLLADWGYTVRRVETPPDILHFKTDCGLLDSGTIFSTSNLASTGCFEGYRVIEAPDGEEAAANLIRINSQVFINAGYPKTKRLLSAEGYAVRTLPTSQAALIDGGLSCMSLRF